MGAPPLPQDALVRVVNAMVGTFCAPDAPLRLRVPDVVRAALMDEAVAVLSGGSGGTPLAVAPPPLPRGGAERDTRVAGTAAPVPCSLGCVVAAEGGGLEGDFQAKVNVALRVGCLFDGILVEVLREVEGCVLGTLFESGVGRRLSLLRFKRRGRAAPTVGRLPGAGSNVYSITSFPSRSSVQGGSVIRYDRLTGTRLAPVARGGGQGRQ